MKFSEAATRYEECFGQGNSDGGGGCLYEDCPLHKIVVITAGAPDDEQGEITWRVEGCTLMGQFEEWFKNKKPGTRYPEEAQTEKET